MAGRILHGKRKGALLMIHEFTLDPASVNDLPSFKYIVDQCGVHSGRLISQFPHKWVKMAVQACNIQSDVKRKSVVEKLISMRRDQKLAGFNREYDDGKDWLQNAEAAHATRPFRAIISPNNPQSRAHVLLPDEIGEKTTLWNVQTQKIVPRRASELAQCATTLLNISRDILFIDPYFDPIKTRFLNTLSHMISYAFALKEPRRLELHVEYDDQKEQRRGTDWQRDCLQNLHPLIPEGFKMEVFRWKTKPSGDKPHARYVLTEWGGIHYDYGLDEWEGDGQTTDVSLLTQLIHRQRWRDYQKETAAFGLEINFFVSGTKAVEQ
jgi:hypothetical protein